MTGKYSAKDILAHLNKQNIGVLGTTDKKSQYIRLRVMYYGVDENFNCYLMSTRDSPKINQILFTSSISFLVFGLEDPYDKSWEVEVDGNAKILEQKEEINHALEKLKERNPFADVAIEANISTQFVMIKLIPKTVIFRLYGEALKGETPTILEL